MGDFVGRLYRPADSGARMTVISQALPARIGGVLRSAGKVKGAQWIRIHRQTERDLELVASSPVNDEELASDLARIALVEETQIRVRDDLASLPQNGEPAVYILTITSEEGRELARDRIRLRTSSAPTDESTALARPGPPPGSVAWEHNEERSPTNAVMAAALLRQQYRHNEALAGSVVKSYAGTIQQTTALLGTLSEALDKSIRARLSDAELHISNARQARTMEAEARAEEMRAEAMKLAAGTLAEWLPVGIHKIARKYGMSGDDAIDPLLEKMILSFKPEQLDSLQGILSPLQREMLGDVWCMVNDRVKARDAKKAAEAKAREDATKRAGGIVAAIGAGGANGGHA